MSGTKSSRPPVCSGQDVTGYLICYPVLQNGVDDEPTGVDNRMGPVELFTKLHSAQALAAFCAHIGRVKKQPVVPCGAGAAHPCCTKKELQMEKMRVIAAL